MCKRGARGKERDIRIEKKERALPFRVSFSSSVCSCWLSPYCSLMTGINEVPYGIFIRNAHTHTWMLYKRARGLTITDHDDCQQDKN